jgi:SprT-like protein
VTKPSKFLFVRSLFFSEFQFEPFNVIVHYESIHAWQYHEFGEANHGETFTRWTDRLDTSQHCERFTTPKWWLVCEDCGGWIARYRRSKTMRNPEQYCCGECGGSLHVEEGGGHCPNAE